MFGNLPRLIRQLICILLSFLLAFTPLLGYPRTAQAADPTVALSALNGGDTVTFAGYTWIVLKPSEGYLLMQNAFSNKEFEWGDNIGWTGFPYWPFDPARETNIGYYLNNTFLNGLSPAEQAMIQTHSWSNGGHAWEEQGFVDCKVGLLAYSEYCMYTNNGSDDSIISKLPVGWWLRSNYQGNDCSLYVHPTEEGMFGDGVAGSNSNAKFAVRPAIYLAPGTLVTGGNGGNVLVGATSSISNVTLDRISHEVGTSMDVVVGVSTSNVPDGNDVAVSLVDKDKNALTSAVAVTGKIAGNGANLTLSLPDSLAAGNYYVETAVEGAAEKEYRSYTINHHAPGVSITPTSHNEKTAQDVTVSVTTSGVANGTTLYITLVDNNKDAVADVGAFQETVADDSAEKILFLPQTLKAGNYFIKVSGEGMETAYVPYEIKPTVPLVTLSPASHNFGFAQSVTVGVTTNGVADETNVTAALMENGHQVNTVDPVNGMIQSDKASLTLVIPATLAAGDYYVQVEVAGITEKGLSQYKIQVPAPDQCTIALAANPANGGTVEGGGTYTVGTQVTVTAQANSAYNFINWTQDGQEVSVSASYSFTCLGAGNIELTANFQAKPGISRPLVFIPVVATDSATEIKGDRATLNGYILETGGAECTGAHFQYRQNGDSSWRETPVKGVFLGRGDYFSAELQGLKPGSEYEFRARARNTQGWGTGGIRSFRMLCPPEVVTGEAEKVDINSAEITGLITSDGGDPVTESGFMFGTSPENLQKIKVGSPGQKVLFHRLTNLTLNKKYYYSAYATNSVDTVYGEIKSFQTARFLVMTNPAENIGLESATLSGNAYITLGDNTSITGCGFRYGTGTDVDKHKRVMAEALPDHNRKFSLILTGLKPGTEYSYQAIVWNESSESYGPLVSFKTLTNIPVVETLNASSLSADSAILSGYIAKNNGLAIIQSGIKWGLDPELKNLKLVPLGPDYRTFSFSLSGLLPLTKYYTQAYAINAAGTGYGDTISFTTPPALPVVTTKDATFDQEAWAARLAGKIEDTGGVPLSEYGFRYSTDQEEWLTLAMGQDHDGDYSSESMYSLSNLQPGLTYYFQAYAVNSSGTSYGEILNFTTITPPQVTASIDLKWVKADSVILSGEIIDTGGKDAVCIRRQFRYREGENELWLEAGVEEGSFGPGIFTLYLSGLKPGTTYEFQARARNFAGWADSQLIEFTTTWGDNDKQAAANLKAAGYTIIQIANILKADYENTAAATLAALQFAGFQLQDIANALRYSDYKATAAQITASFLENGLDIALAMEMAKQYFYDERYSYQYYNYMQIKAVVQGGYSYTDVAETLGNRLNINSLEVALEYLFGAANNAGNYYWDYLPKTYPTKLGPEVDGAILKAVAQVYGDDSLRQYLWTKQSNESAVYALKLLGDGPYEIASLIRNQWYGDGHRTCAYVLLRSGGFTVAETADALVQIYGNNPGYIFHAFMYDSRYPGRQGIYPAPLVDVVKYLVENLQVDLPRMAAILTQNRSDLYRSYSLFTARNALQLLHQHYDPTALELAQALYAAGWTDPSVQSQDGYNLQALADDLRTSYRGMTAREMLGTLKQTAIPPTDLAEVMTRTWQGIAWTDYCREEGYTALDVAGFYQTYFESSSWGSREVHISFTITNLARIEFDLRDIVLAVKTVYEVDQQEALLEFTRINNLPWNAFEIAEAVAEIYGGNLDFVRIMVEQMKMAGASPAQIVSTLRHTYKIDDPIRIAGYMYPPQSIYSEKEVLKAVIRNFVQPYSHGNALKLARQLAAEVYGINEVNLMILQAVCGDAPPGSLWDENPDAKLAVYILQDAGFTLDQIVQVLKSPPQDGYSLTAMQVLDLLNLGTYSKGNQALSFADKKYDYGYKPHEVIAAVVSAFGGDLIPIKLKAIRDNVATYTVPKWILDQNLNSDPRWLYAAYLALGTIYQDFGISDLEKAALYLREAGFSEQEILDGVTICSSMFGQIPQLDLLCLLVKNVFGADDYETFAVKFKQLLGEKQRDIKLPAEGLQKAFPELNTSQTALALGKTGYPKRDIASWLMYHTSQVKDSALAAILGSAQPGDLGLECHDATLILQSRGYKLQEAAEWLIKNKYHVNELFVELVNNYTVADPVKVITVLKAHYDIDQLTGASNYYNKSFYSHTYGYLVDAGFSRESVITALLKTTKKSAADLISIIYWHDRRSAEESNNTIKRLTLTEIGMVLYNVGMKNPELDLRLPDIVQGLLYQFPLDWTYTAAKDLTAQFLRDTTPYGSDAEKESLDHLTLYILREAGLSSGDAAAIQVIRGVGLSTGSIIKSYIGVGNDWMDAVTNLAEAGYSFGDSFSAVWDNETYHLIIGASILSQMATKAISFLSESQKVVDGIKYAKKIAKYGFKIGEAIF